ncbi:MAG: hypothetical protein ACRDNZ_08375 [Streptosporangiaceae bacterium]
MSYRPVLTSRAAAQFSDLMSREDVYETFMDRLLRLVDAPWDAWLVQPGGGEPDFREAQFGDSGLIAFRLHEDAGLLVVLYILWVG